MLSPGLHNIDAMQALKEYPDNYFELAIADPPYGEGLASEGGCKGWFAKYHQSPENLGGGGRPGTDLVNDSTSTSRRHYTFGLRKRDKNYKNRRNMGDEIRKKIITWDVAPKQEFFEELFRVSRNQIIWGGNYFVLPPTRCFLIWRKLTISDSFSMAMAEYAWTSFNSNAKVFEAAPQDPTGMRFHPTQKPVKLYEWILEHYANPGDKILDPMAGSGSCLIACHNKGYECTGFEIDSEYFEKATERIQRETAQMNIFDFINKEPTP